MTAPRSGTSSGEACWNRIGVWGQQSPRCSRLDELIHCRNCDVYVEAALQLQDRPLPPGYRELWRQHYAKALPVREIGGRSAVLVFRIGPEWLALPAGRVEEILDPVPVHGLPHHHGGSLQGIVNIHGRLRLHVSLANLLGIEGQPGAAMGKRQNCPRMVIVRREERCFAFSADQVWGVYRHLPADLMGVPSTLAGDLAKFSEGLLDLGEMRVGRLDETLLFQALEEKRG